MSAQYISRKPNHKDPQFVPFNEANIESSIPGRFEAQVEKFPDNIAVKEENNSLTYRELNDQANRVARVILAHNEESDRPIIILTGHGCSAMIAIMEPARPRIERSSRRWCSHGRPTPRE